MKRLVLLAAVATFAACTFDYKDDYNGPAYVVVPESAESAYALDVCYDEPPWYEPDWCDYYDDGDTCCVWYVEADYSEYAPNWNNAGWYEEWCQWSNDWCWEYNGAW
jgi:hypothetical protein